MYLDTLYICTECSENFVFHSTNLNPVLIKKKLCFILNILCSSIWMYCNSNETFQKEFNFFIEIWNCDNYNKIIISK